MKKILITAFCLTGCVTSAQQTKASPSISQIQGGCFASRENFLDQTACIKNAISGQNLNPYAQEYMAYMQSLNDQVEIRKISGGNARVQLTKRLNELRQVQNNEFTQQEILANQKAIQTRQILQQNKLPPVELYIPPQPVQTNCTSYGNQVNCTTR